MIGVVLVALGLVAGSWWFARLRALPAAGPADATSGVTVSVVIPARDEEHSLPALLASLHGSTVRPSEVIVVDDASTDATADLAVDGGATVVRLFGDPPPGWTGKAFACARGAAAAGGELLLFLDADVTVAPSGLARLIAAHARHGGLISVQPRHRVERVYEELSATCNVVAMMGSGAFAPWPPPRPVGYGPCILTTATDYTRAGGHAAVRGDVIEDTQLARRFAACGLPTTAFAGTDALSFRMYPGGLRQLVDGWSKSLAAGAGQVSGIAVLASAWWVTACLTIGLRGITAALDPASVDQTEAVLVIGGWLAVIVQFRWMLRRIGSFRLVTAVLHPVPMGAFVALFARSLWLTTVRRQVRWRGRRLPVAARPVD